MDKINTIGKKNKSVEFRSMIIKMTGTGNTGTGKFTFNPPISKNIKKVIIKNVLLISDIVINMNNDADYREYDYMIFNIKIDMLKNPINKIVSNFIHKNNGASYVNVLNQQNFNEVYEIYSSPNQINNTQNIILSGYYDVNGILEYNEIDTDIFILGIDFLFEFEDN